MAEFRSARFTTAMLSIVLVALLVGCAESGPACYPVRGEVQMGGKPLAEAMVVFHPQGDQPQDIPRPIATTTGQGEFELTTLRPGDGAPVGKYAITIELRQPRQVGDEVIRDGANLLPPRYAKPDTSPLSYEVSEGENQVPAIVVGR